ncbi:MAG: hypothetical protein ACR2G5_13150 [Pyrinomonadaceae bacterium]
MKTTKMLMLLSLTLVSILTVQAQERERTVYPPLPRDVSVRPVKPSDPTYITAGSSKWSISELV